MQGGTITRSTKVSQRNKIASTKIRSSQSVTHQPKTQTFFTVNEDQAGLIGEEPKKKLFNSSMCLVCTGIEHVTPSTDFRILLGNVGKHRKTLTVGRTVAVAAEHPTLIMESPITHGEVLGVAVEKLYPKRPCDVKADEVINRYLAKNREEVFGEKEEEPITVEAVSLSVDKKYH